MPSTHTDLQSITQNNMNQMVQMAGDTTLVEALTTTNLSVYSQSPTSNFFSSTTTLPTQTASSASIDVTPSLPPSTDGKCGPKSYVTCTGSTFGSCCSIENRCGNDQAHCAIGRCQAPKHLGDCNIITVVPTHRRRLRRRHSRHRFRHWVL